MLVLIETVYGAHIIVETGNAYFKEMVTDSFFDRSAHTKGRVSNNCRSYLCVMQCWLFKTSVKTGWFSLVGDIVSEIEMDLYYATQNTPRSLRPFAISNDGFH